MNEINTLHRLSLFNTKDNGDPVLNHIGNGRAWAIIRILMGKTYEGHEFVKKRILKLSFGEKYRPLLSSDGKAALARVTKRFDTGLLAALKNKFALHYDDTDALQTGFGKLDSDDDLAMYSATTGSRHTTVTSVLPIW